MAATPPKGTTHVQGTKAPAFIIETQEARRVHYLKLLIYGNYGVGKTTLAATASEVDVMQDVLMINSELGDLSLDTFPNVYRAYAPDYKTVSKIFDYLRAHTKAWASGDKDRLIAMEANLTGKSPEEIKEPRCFKTLIVDSLSEVDALSMQKILGIDHAITRLEEETNMPEWAEYKQNFHAIMRLARGLRDIPMHVIYICGEKFLQDEIKRQKFSPDLTGQLSKKIQGFMDMVGYMQASTAGEGSSILRRLSVLPTNRYDAKHRYASFKGSHFDDPTIGSILKEVGLLNNKGAPLQ